MAKKGQKFKKYEKELKLQVVIERINGESLGRLKEKYEIPSDAMIVRWVKEYKEIGMKAFEDKRKFTKEQNPTKGRPREKYDSLEEELKAVKLENEYLKKQEALRRGCTIEELGLWSSRKQK